MKTIYGIIAILIARNNYKLIGYDNNKNKIKQIQNVCFIFITKMNLKNF